MRLRTFLSCLLLIFLVGGCTTANKNVVNNTFMSETNPQANLIVPDQFGYLGSISFIERDDPFRWNKKSYVFVEDAEKNHVVDRILHFQTNKINRVFRNNLLGHIKEYVVNSYVQINGKMCPLLISAIVPASGYYVTDFIYDKGYILSPVILSKEVIIPIHKDYLFTVFYSEDVSPLGYTAEEWNDGKLDEVQQDFVVGFNKRFRAAVDLKNIKQ